MLIITKDSHLDHALTSEHLRILFRECGDREGFFIHAIDLPSELSLPCNLWGPIMGDQPINDVETIWGVRGARLYASRLLLDRTGQYSDRVRPSAKLTVIAGPHNGQGCVLYTAFGGPLAPKEPNDPTLKDSEREESTKFWSEHALTVAR